MDDVATLWVALATARGARPALLRALAERHGGVRGLADAVDAGALGPDDGAEGSRGDDPLPALRAALAPAALARARERVRAWTAAGDTLLHPESPTYPPLLGHVHDPPAMLLVRGALPRTVAWGDDDARAVAVVGTRRATPWGERFATRLGRELAEAGVVVVSGLALGIDGAAHRGALEAEGGRTVAVLGSGLDRLHPAAHRGLAARVARQGAVVSEYPSDASARPGFFPRRNRIIAGLARAVVVVEAPAKSGARITARLAGEEGRTVFAVPQRPDSTLGRGALELLHDGAAAVGSADDVLGDLGWVVPDRARDPRLDPLQRALLDAMRHGGDGGPPAPPPGAPPGAVLAALTELEILGLARRDPRGGWHPT